MGRTEIANGFDARSIERAVSLLRDGEVVAFPTETVYGLGANAFDPVAVAKIFELKRRPHFDPLIVHVSEKEAVSELAREIPAQARLLMDRFWPGPLTIILDKKETVPDIVTAGLSTVAVRMPGHPVALELIARLGKPIAAPSANPFGYVSTTTAEDVAGLFDDRLRLVLDGGPSNYGIESTIVSIRDGHVWLHRHGSTSLEELTDLVGRLSEKGHDNAGCEAPGELPYHYAPHTPLRIVATPAEIEVPDSAFLSFRKPAGPVKSKHVMVLSETGDLREAASRFFSSLIQLDRQKVEIIYAERVPERGLGRAMMERLKKAQRRSSA